MKIVGLTGGIASGKSTVANLIREKNVPVVDADQLARDVVKVGSDGLHALVEAFGSELLREDGSLHREKLGQIVFADEEKRSQLNSILHPRIGILAAATFQDYQQQGHSLLVYEVPLLFENNLQHSMHVTLLVSLPKEEQIQRLCQRNQLSREEALQRINSQMLLEEKEKLADFVLENDGDLNQLQGKFEQVWNRVLEHLGDLSP